MNWDSLHKIPGSRMSLAISIIPWLYTRLVINYYSHDCHKRKQEPQLPLLYQLQTCRAQCNTKTLFSSRWEFQDGRSGALNQVWGLLSTGAVAAPQSWPCPPQAPWTESAGGRVSEDDFYKSLFPVPSHMCILHSSNWFQDLGIPSDPEGCS